MIEFTALNFLFFLIIGLSLAEFAMQIVLSDLAHWIKGWLFLNQPYPEKLQTLSVIPFWRKLLKHWWFLATPFIFLINIHKFISSLFGCPWCIGFWLMLTTNYFYLKMDIITALLLAPICLVWVTILDRLHTNG